MKKMNLYIWNKPYSVSHGGSFLFVIAPNLEAAKEQAKTAPIYHFGIYDNRRQLGSWELGDPTRVIECSEFPYAEVYQWEE